MTDPMTDEELHQILERATEDQLRDFVTGMLFSGMKAATDRGVPPLKAMRALVAGYLEESLGTGVWKELGVPTRTAERWRRELREALAAAPEIEDEPPVEIVQAYLRLRAEKLAKDEKRAMS